MRGSLTEPTEMNLNTKKEGNGAFGFSNSPAFPFSNALTPRWPGVILHSQRAGGMAEWFKAAVLKTVEQQCSGSSNLSPSARKFPEGKFHYWPMADGEWL
jgi:hypothetical protein